MQGVVLAGCLAQRYYEEIDEEIPEIDICIGTTAIDSIANALNEFFINKKNIHVINDIDKLAGVNAPRNLSTAGN